jgi:6,7-dimethyl-8-ribityllumazine synthase
LARIAYIQASWHTDITDNCKEAFVEEMTKEGWDLDDIHFYAVPGSLEIPLTAKLLAQSGRYDAVCCSGLVVDGGIYRHDFVAQAVLHGIVQVSMQTETPILSAILTPQQFHEHETHVEFFKTHMLTKGKELAQACLSIQTTLKQIPNRRPGPRR